MIYTVFYLANADRADAPMYSTRWEAWTNVDMWTYGTGILCAVALPEHYQHGIPEQWRSVQSETVRAESATSAITRFRRWQEAGLPKAYLTE